MFRPDDLFLQMIAFDLLHFYDRDGREITWDDLSEEDKKFARKAIYEILTPTYKFADPREADDPSALSDK